MANPRYRMRPSQWRYYEGVGLLGFMVEVGIIRQGRTGVLPPSDKSTAFDDARVLGGIMRRFTEISAVAVTLP